MGDKPIVQLNINKKMEKQKFRKRVAVALDFSTPGEALAFLDKNFQDKHLLVKVGMELFYASCVAGVNIVKEIRDRGHEIFLDLKLCDIKNTEHNAMAVLKSYDVAAVNVHAFGGHEMMRAALEGVKRADGTRPLVLAVTVLTSMNQDSINRLLPVEIPLKDLVMLLANAAIESGLDGIIASVEEAQMIREAFGPDVLIFSPAIRFKGSSVDDQKRARTPEDARLAGVDVIIMGRDILRAEDLRGESPRAAYERAVREFCGDSNEEE